MPVVIWREAARAAEKKGARNAKSLKLRLNTEACDSGVLQSLHTIRFPGWPLLRCSSTYQVLKFKSDSVASGRELPN